MEAGQRERRQFGSLRIPAQLQVQFSEHAEVSFQTLNISQNGILVKSPENLDIGEVVRVYIQVPPSLDKVESLGRIARKIHRDGIDFLGIQFLEMDITHRERWLEFMATVEGLSTDKNQVTSSSVMLEERKKEGRNRQIFLMRFDNKDILQRFMADSILQGKCSFPYTMTRTPGDLVGLVIVHPDTDRTLEVEAQVIAAKEESHYDHLSLIFAPFTDEQKDIISQFMDGQSQFEETATHEQNQVFEDLSDNEQTVIMDNILDDDEEQA